MGIFSEASEVKRLASQLEDHNLLMNRLVGAVERLSPPPLYSNDNEPYQASLSDYRRTDDQANEKLKAEFAIFAENNNVQIDSESFFKSIMQYEEEIAQVYGPQAISELPWNKVAGHSIFRGPAQQNQIQQGDQGGAQPPVHHTFTPKKSHVEPEAASGPEPVATRDSGVTVAQAATTQEDGNA